MNTNQLIKTLTTDFTVARCDLSAKACTWLDTLSMTLGEAIAMYKNELGYKIEEVAEQHSDNKKAYKFLKNEGFTTEQIKLMGTSI